jgi:hypothetical protein
VINISFESSYAIISTWRDLRQWKVGWKFGCCTSSVHTKHIWLWGTTMSLIQMIIYGISFNNCNVALCEKFCVGFIR